MRFPRSPRTVATIGLLLGALGCSTSPALAVYIRADVPVEQYNTIAQLQQYAAAGFLQVYSPGSTPSTISVGSCSGTLISPTKVLTAAHCFDKNATGVTTATGGSFGFDTTVPSDPAQNYTQFALSPLWSTGPTKGKETNDIAIVTLSTPITNIAPAKFLEGNPTGLQTAFVGYGGQGTGAANGSPAGATNRLGGYNVIDVANTNTIRFDFDSPDGTSSSTGTAVPLPLEGSVAQGDSGSALFVQIGNDFLVVGDLNAGVNPVFGSTKANLYGELNLYAPVINPDNTAFILMNASDAVFERRTVVNGMVTDTQISSATLLANIKAFGSVLSPDQLAEDAVQVPEPASMLLLTSALGAIAAGRRRGRAQFA